MRFLPFSKGKKGFQFAGGGVDTGGGSAYTLPTAAADTKGGVKIGGGLTMNGEVLSAGVSYSTTEFDTGNKWIDNRTIYGMVYNLQTPITVVHNTFNAYPSLPTQATVILECWLITNDSNRVCVPALAFNNGDGQIDLTQTYNRDVTVNTVIVKYVK